MIKKGTYFKTEGGFGNRLLNYIDARKKGYTPYFGYKRLFNITGEKVLPVKINNTTKLELLETFIGLTYSDLERIIPLSQSADSGTVIHFRGKDFENWKPHSIICSKWYIDQIERLQIKNFIFVTDDFHHKTSKELLQYAHNNDIKYSCYDSVNYLSDWWMIYNSNILITGPSTFSLTAGVLGKSRIVLNKKYAKIEASNGSKFWLYLLESETIKSEIFTNFSLH